MEVLKKKTQIRLFQWNKIKSTKVSSSSESTTEANTSGGIADQLVSEIFIMISKNQYANEHQCSRRV